MRDGRSPDRGPYGSSHAVWPVAGSRAVWPIPWGWSSRAVWPVAGSRAVWPVAGSRPVTSRSVSATLRSLPCSRWGIPTSRRLPCPGPTWRCSRRRHQRFANIYSFIWRYRFIMARSAARLSAIVGPQIPACPSNVYDSDTENLKNCHLLVIYSSWSLVRIS